MLARGLVAANRSYFSQGLIFREIAETLEPHRP